MIPIPSVYHIREADRYTIENEPISSEKLMYRAAEQLFAWLDRNGFSERELIVVGGPGNNGGDGFVVALLWQQAGRKVRVYHPEPSLLSPDAKYYYKLLEQAGIKTGLYESAYFDGYEKGKSLVIDALFGTGLSRSLSGEYAVMADKINDSGLEIVAVDLPSGLFSEDNSENEFEHIVRAHHTLTFQFPKLCMLFPEHYIYVGNWEVLPIGLHPDYIHEIDSAYQMLTAWAIKKILRIRKPFDHKGVFGHAFLVAGSYGKMGAAVLAGRACLRSGAGLLTIHVPRFGYDIIQNTVPEAMASIDKYDKLISKIPGCDGYTAIGIGPGIGKSMYTHQALKDLLQRSSCPLLLDADAINLLAEHQELLDLLPAGTILTPHYKEFERLVGPSSNHYVRLQKQLEFAERYQVVVVLKGAYTSITDQNGICFFNPTGNPGMAKGGSGDVLTGMILAFLAQGYEPLDAAKLGVYLHGLAGDIAVTDFGEEALLPGDFIKKIGAAFEMVKNA